MQWKEEKKSEKETGRNNSNIIKYNNTKREDKSETHSTLTYI